MDEKQTAEERRLEDSARRKARIAGLTLMKVDRRRTDSTDYGMWVLIDPAKSGDSALLLRTKDITLLISTITEWAAKRS